MFFLPLPIFFVLLPRLFPGPQVVPVLSDRGSGRWFHPVFLLFPISLSSILCHEGILFASRWFRTVGRPCHVFRMDHEMCIVSPPFVPSDGTKPRIPTKPIDPPSVHPKGIEGAVRNDLGGRPGAFDRRKGTSDRKGGRFPRHPSPSPRKHGCEVVVSAACTAAASPGRETRETSRRETDVRSTRARTNETSTRRQR